ncbi:MAG: hypothetical protein H7Z19_06555 [Chitinophagaceae bacterium]|nr:hypothetical protein [Rubrivivax sp.]
MDRRHRRDAAAEEVVTIGVGAPQRLRDVGVDAAEAERRLDAADGSVDAALK